MSELPSAPLLAIKLHIPRTRRALVSRPRLLARMDEAFARPLALLVAPPGFGKTTLIAEWAALRGRGVAWLSLDAGDNDPTVFWSYIIAALETLRPGVRQSALELLGSSQPSMQAMLAALINVVSTFPEEFSLVLDDYHAVDNDRIHEAVAFLFAHLPPSMHVIIATRADPPFPLARLRARDEVIELRAVDLRFNAEEARNFLQATAQLSLAAEQVAALEARTEGWIAGLQLAALALREQEADDIAEFIAASVSNNRFILDYLMEEVLARQPEALQLFLWQTSLLDRLCAPLCDAVTGRDDGQATLEYLERANLFIIPLDPQRQWYRYHTLFGDVLQKLLMQKRPELAPGVHLRASAWYEQQGLVRDAIDHALAIPDHARAARLIEESAMLMLTRGEVVTMLRWLGLLSPDVVREHPRLCLYYAVALTMGGNLEAVEGWLDAAERAAAAAGVADDEFAGQVATIRALLAARTADTTRVIELTGRALDTLPESRSFLRATATWIRGIATAGSDAGTGSFSEVVSASHLIQDSPWAAMALYTFGFIEQRKGRLALALDLYRRALQVLHGRDESANPLAGLTCLGMGEVLRQQSDLAAAQEYLDRGLRLSQHWGSNPDSAAHGYVSLAWVRQARGEEDGALAAIDTAFASLGSSLTAWTTTLLQAHQAHLWIVQGNLAAAERWAEARQWRVASESDDARLFYPRHLELMTWARFLIAQGHPAPALAVLDELLPRLLGGAWMKSQIRIKIVSALAHDGLGDAAEAQAALHEALALAAPHGYVRIFHDEGAPAIALLARTMRSGIECESSLAAHAERVLAAGALPASAVEPAVSPVRTVEPLSPRELEVLRLVAIGLDNHEIAERLVLSVGTVKSHIHSIYGKLGVADRTQAVIQAQKLHLV